MSTRQQWLAANEDFLAGRLAWLRRRLEVLAGDRPASGSGAPPTERTPMPEPAPPAGHESGGLPLPLLCRAFKLSDFEGNMVLLCAAMELDTGMGRLCADAQHDDGLPHPTYALAMALFDDAAWDAMSPERPLRRWSLIVPTPGPSRTLLTARLALDERLVNYIKGLNHMDARLRPLMEPMPPPAQGLPPSQAKAAEDVAALAARTDTTHAVLLLGPNQDSKKQIAARAAALRGKRLFRIAAGDLAAGPGSVQDSATLWHRETLLCDVALYVDAAGADASSPDAPAVRHWLSHGGGIVFLDVRDTWPGVSAPAVDISKPTPEEQRHAWAQLAAPPDAARLAGQFNFDVAAIQHALAGARRAGTPSAGNGTDEAGSDSTGARLWSAALALARPALDRLAQRIDATATLADLKLPAPEAALLQEIAGQVTGRDIVYNDYGFAARMSRGLGISVLFAGESGTGKTMAAEALAGELGLLLYRIDLSAVVSKYIGETEKNLRRLFDAAENGGAVLFFDEADALFGKRSEVKDSHDRYANIEVSYLLQRMEQFRGLAVLASNRKDALDQAFLRRLRFVVNFPFPALAERRAIWASTFPESAPVDQLNLDRLARLNLTGGSITNVALNAAFLAAADGGRITMPLVLSAARTEFRKLERPLNGADFHWQEPEAGNGP